MEENSIPVARENRLGVVPTDWLGDVALLLQRGITDTLSAAPGTGASTREYPAPSSGGHTVFRSESPDRFAQVRKALHISETEFFASMALSQGQTQSSMRVISKSMAAGRSNAFFFVSPNQRFLIKSMSSTELRLMLRLLQPYTEHLAETRLSLLPRYVGRHPR